MLWITFFWQKIFGASWSWAVTALFLLKQCVVPYVGDAWSIGFHPFLNIPRQRLAPLMRTTVVECALFLSPGAGPIKGHHSRLVFFFVSLTAARPLDQYHSTGALHQVFFFFCHQTAAGPLDERRSKVLLFFRTVAGSLDQRHRTAVQLLGSFFCCCIKPHTALGGERLKPESNYEYYGVNRSFVSKRCVCVSTLPTEGPGTVVFGRGGGMAYLR